MKLRISKQILQAHGFNVNKMTLKDRESKVAETLHPDSIIQIDFDLEYEQGIDLLQSKEAFKCVFGPLLGPALRQELMDSLDREYIGNRIAGLVIA